MLIYLYLASLIFGGVLLGASLLLGGHDDLDADVSADMGGDVDLGDVDMDADLELEGDAEAEHGGFASAGADFFLWPLRSIRFWTFFTAFFGMTGVAFSSLGLAGPILTLVLALSVGILSGGAASAIIRRFSSDDTGRAPQSSDYVGKMARVVVPVNREGVGKVRVRVGGQLVDVLAVTDDEKLTSEDDVIVIEMDGTRARVARLEKD